MTVLVVGLGSIAAKHIAALREIDPQVHIIALRSSGGAKEVNGVTSIYDWSDIKETPDFVLVSNPTLLHRDAIREATRFSCPVFIEKPVLASPEDAGELLPILEKSGQSTYVACNLRFHPCIVFLRELVSSIRINEVNAYCGSDLAQWRPGQDYTTSYSASAEMGGGVHLDLIHELDYCWWLFGKPEHYTGIRRKTSPLHINSADFAAFHLCYPGFTANVVLNYYRKAPRRTLEIVCEEGVIECDLLQCTIMQDGLKIFEDRTFKMADTYLRQMNYFVDHVTKARPMMNDFREALEVLKIATA